MLGFILQDAIAFKIHKIVIPMCLMRCDIEDKEIEHRDKSEAFIELGKRF